MVVIGRIGSTTTGADGAGIASNDDSGGPDSYLRFTVPEDGDYCFQGYDHLLPDVFDGLLGQQACRRAERSGA